MTRDISEIAAYIQDDVIHPFFALDLMFDTTTTVFKGQTVNVQPLYFWTGLGDLVIGSETYTGTGQILSIGEVKETSDISAAGVTVSMSGIPSDLISMALQVPYINRTAKIHLGLFVNGDFASPALSTLFVGKMDQMNVDEGPDTCTINMSIENDLIATRPKVSRYTSESQKSKYPNDKAFDFIPDLQTKTFVLGGSA